MFLSCSVTLLRSLSLKFSKVFSLDKGGSETSVLSELTEADECFFLQNFGGLRQEPAQSSCNMWPWEDRAGREKGKEKKNVAIFILLDS